MSSTFSTNLAIELIGTGDQAGAWGNTTNTNLGTLIEQAISGYVTQAVITGTDTTITIPNGATGVARNMFIELTGTGGTNTNLIVPANKKLYFIYNNSTGAVTVKVSGQTGVSVPTGKKMVLVSNGTDIVNGLNYIADFGTNSFTVTNLTATSATITTFTATSSNITTLSGTNFSATSLTLTNALRTSQGGTGVTTTPTNGQLLIGNGSGYTVANLTAGFGITVTNSAGGITLAATSTASGTVTGVTASSPLASSGGTAPNISISSSTGSGAVVLASGAQFSATSANVTTLSATNLTVTNTINGSISGNAATATTATTATSATSATTATNVSGGGQISAASATITTITSTSAQITTLSDGAGNVRKIPSAGSEKTSLYTLSTNDIGEFVTIGSGGAINVPNDTFSAGDAVSIFNNTTSGVTITLTVTTAYVAGADTDRDSLTLSTRGVATVLFINSSLCVLSGNVS